MPSFISHLSHTIEIQVHFSFEKKKLFLIRVKQRQIKRKNHRWTKFVSFTFQLCVAFIDCSWYFCSIRFWWFIFTGYEHFDFGACFMQRIIIWWSTLISTDSYKSHRSACRNFDSCCCFFFVVLLFLTASLVQLLDCCLFFSCLHCQSITYTIHTGTSSFT